MHKIGGCDKPRTLAVLFIRAFILIVTLCNSLFLIQCKSKSHEGSLNIKFTVPQKDIPLPPDLVVYEIPVSVYGEWMYSDYMFYSARLTLNRNGTFIFFQQGCTGSGYSEGNFVNHGSTQVLTSYDKYKKMEKLSFDSTYIYFNKTVFLFEDAFLYEVDKNGLKSNSKYIHIKNFR